MNKKQKVVSTTLSTITALSSVATLSSIPNKALDVHALEGENTTETAKPTTPTVKAELEKKIDETNKEVVARGTVLKSVQDEKEKSEAQLNSAKENKEQNDYKITSSTNQVDSSLAREILERAQKVTQLQTDLSNQKQQKEEVEKLIEEKEAQLVQAQENYKQAENTFNLQAEQNKDTLEKLNEAKEEKQTCEETIRDLNEQLASLNTQIEETNALLQENNDKLDENKTTLNQLSDEKNTLEQQLSSDKERLNNLKSLLDQQPSDQTIQQLQEEIDNLQQEVDSKERELSLLDQQIETLSTQIEEQKITINDTQFKQTQLTNQYNELTTQINEAQTTLDTAQNSYNSLKQIVDDLNNNIDTSELTKLKEELAELQKQQATLETAVNDYTKQLADAENELSNAYIKYNDNVVSFYKEVYRETGSLDAYHAFTELEKYDGVEYTAKSTMSENIGTATIYDSKNYDQTMASLSDLKEAINYIKMCNAIREYEGLSPLKVSYYLMTVSAIQNQYSSVTIDHSAKYNVGENLYWRMGDYKSERFLDENGNLDVEFLNQLGRNPTQHIQRANPFYGWWIEEKVDYEKTHNQYNDGHYLNIVNGSYTLTGFSHNNQVHNDYYHTWGQVFSSRLSLENVDGSGYTSIDGVTVDEFEEALNAWILKKANGVQIEQSNVDTVKTLLTNTTNDLNSKQQEVTNKQAEINNYKNNINTQYQEATNNYNQAKQTYDTLVEKQATTKTQLDETTTNLASQRENLTSLTHQLSSLEGQRETLNESTNSLKNTLNKKKTDFSDLTKNKAELEATISEVSKQIDQTNTLIEENNEKTTKLNTTITTIEEAIAQNKTDLNTFNTNVSSVSTQKETSTTQLNNLNKTIENYNAALQEYNQAKQEFENVTEFINELQTTISTSKEKQQKLSSEIENTTNQVALANTNQTKVMNAKKQWEAIKNGESKEYGSYDDQVLDSLNSTINEYIQAKSLTSSLEMILEDAQKDFAPKNEKYLEALKNYNQAIAEYDQSRDALNTFIKDHGVITVDTIIIPEEVEYTGEQITPGVSVMDSKGNTVDLSEYTITYGENTELGTGSITITMNGNNYVGTFTKTFKIVEKQTESNQETLTPTTTSNDTKNISNDDKTTSPKTGDTTNITQLGVMSFISLLFYSLLKRKDKKEENA